MSETLASSTGAQIDGNIGDSSTRTIPIPDPDAASSSENVPSPNVDWEDRELEAIKANQLCKHVKVTYYQMAHHLLHRQDHITAKNASQGNELWKRCRMYRITGSVVANMIESGYVYSRSEADAKEKRRLKSLGAVRSLIEDTFKGNGATEYGTRHEDDACAAFEMRETWRQRRVYSPNSTGPLVEHAGLQVARNNPMFACSTDGDVTWPERNNGIPVLLELKAPAKKKLYDWPVVPTYYYPQIQFMMGLTGRYFCFFGCWSGTHMRISVIDFNANYFDRMMRTLANWYCTRLIPAAVVHHNTGKFPSWVPPPEEQSDMYKDPVPDVPLPEWVSSLGSHAFVPSPGFECLDTIKCIEEHVQIAGKGVLASAWRDEHAYYSIFPIIANCEPDGLEKMDVDAKESE